MDVRMPDGTLIRNVPDDVTQEDLLERYSQFQPQGNAVQQTIENIPSSAGKFVGDIAHTIAHPLNTFAGLQMLVSGAAQKIPGVSGALDYARDKLPFIENQIGKPEDVQVADAVGKLYKDRFGGIDNIRNTLIKDPVGAVADLSLIAGGAGLALKGAGLSRAAQIASNVSTAIDPLAATARATVAVAKPIYKFGVGMTSGAGAKAVGQAIEGSPEFLNTMRGKTSEAEVVNTSRDSLQEIRDARSAAYREKLENLQTNKQELPLDDIKSLSEDWLKRYNVTKTSTGELDFSRSTLRGNQTAANEVKNVYEIVKEWGSKVGDATPAMLDVLKRTIGDSFASDRTSRAMVSSLENAVKQKISKAVPEYAEMTKDYAKSSALIKEMEQALSLGSRKAADTSLRKLMMAMREDKNFRSDLIKSLDKAGGSNIEGAAAGLAFNPLWSNRLGAYLTTGAGVGLASVSPILAGLIPLASPRVAGELSVLIGRLGKASKNARVPAAVAYQAGRIQQ